MVGPVAVVAVDPGPTPGVAFLSPTETSVFQCSPDAVLWLVRALLTRPILKPFLRCRLTAMAAAHRPHYCEHADYQAQCRGWPEPPESAAPVVLAVERFVVGPRAGRSSTPKAGAVTREMVGALTALGESLPGVVVVQRSASEVMPWATDKRLEVAELLAITKGMPHARAASRHALFASVKDGNQHDPLSTKVRAP